MPRYAAFLRWVSPLNAKMADVRKVLESAGFTDVKTVLASAVLRLGAETVHRAYGWRAPDGA